MAGLLGLLALAPAAAAAEQTNVELIMDASGSMAARMHGRSKMEIAREVLTGLLADLPADAHVAARAYGHRRKDDRNDIEFVTPLGPKGPAPVEAKALKPVGMTPHRRVPNLLILVSDGKETCRGDLCAVAKWLRQVGVQVEASGVGFDVKADERKQVEYIAEGGEGKYYRAANAMEFQVAAAAPAAPAGAFRDDFEGSKLNPGWRHLKEDRNRWTLQGGKLVLVAQRGKPVGCGSLGGQSCPALCL